MPNLLCLLPLDTFLDASGLPSNLVAETQSTTFYQKDNLFKTRSRLPSCCSPNWRDAVATGPHRCRGGRRRSRQGFPSTRRRSFLQTLYFSAFICPFYRQTLQAPGEERGHQRANGWLQKRGWLWDPAAAMPVQYFGTDL